MLSLAEDSDWSEGGFAGSISIASRPLACPREDEKRE
jgi:hypothetical protein